METHTLNKV